MWTACPAALEFSGGSSSAMRVLFTALAAAGHCYHLIPSAWAFRNAGHDVRVACSSSGVPFVTGAGLTAISTGDDPSFESYWTGMDAAPDPTAAGAQLDREAHRRDRARRSAMMFADLSERMVEPLLAYCRSWRPDLVVFEPRCFSGGMLAVLLGVPSVRHCWGPDSAYLRCPPHTEPLEQSCERLGISWFQAQDGRNPLVGTATLEPAPPSLRHDSLPEAHGFRYVPFNGATIRPGDEQPERGSILVVWSSTFTRAGGHVSPVQTLLDAMADEPVHLSVLISAAGRELLRSVPSNVSFSEGVLLEEALPDCDLVVHAGHGGPTMTAVAAGCPQLIFAGIADSFVNSRLISKAGAGLGVDYHLLEPDLVRERVRTLRTDPSYRSNAIELQRENDALPGPAAVVDWCTQLTGTR